MAGHDELRNLRRLLDRAQVELDAVTMEDDDDA